MVLSIEKLAAIAKPDEQIESNLATPYLNESDAVRGGNSVPFDVCVVGGCGHVGLPLSIAFALQGARVAILDVDHDSMARIARGEMPFIDAGGEERLREALASGNLVIGSDPQVIAQSDAIVLVVATPIDGHMSPSFNAVDDILKAYQGYFREVQILVLRSTLYPGTSARVFRWLLENGLNIDVAVCPERIAQGSGLREILTLPQIVSSFTPSGLTRARRLFGMLNEDLVEMKPIEAELAKLFSNAWRYIKFAVANQYYMICSDLGVDFDTIYHGMTHHYPRAADLPAPGFAAGPCLFKDTMQLVAFTKNHFWLGHAAMLVNEGLPQHVVNMLKRSRADLEAETVGILGMAFKAEVDDGRDSLSYKLKNLLELEARAVICSDPYLHEPGTVTADELVDQSDVIIIATPHNAYKQLDFRAKPVVDVWNLRGEGRSL
jgi:UDP-N-acetyl-D-mannosaminuronic acid dehydrogenase